MQSLLRRLKHFFNERLLPAAGAILAITMLSYLLHASYTRWQASEPLTRDDAIVREGEVAQAWISESLERFRHVDKTSHVAHLRLAGDETEYYMPEDVTEDRLDREGFSNLLTPGTRVRMLVSGSDVSDIGTRLKDSWEKVSILSLELTEPHRTLLSFDQSVARDRDEQATWAPTVFFVMLGAIALFGAAGLIVAWQSFQGRKRQSEST